MSKSISYLFNLYNSPTKQPHLIEGETGAQSCGGLPRVTQLRAPAPHHTASSLGEVCTSLVRVSSMLSLSLHGPWAPHAVSNPSREPLAPQASDLNPAGSLSNRARPSGGQPRLEPGVRVWVAWPVSLWGSSCSESPPLARGDSTNLFLAGVLLLHHVCLVRAFQQGLTLARGGSHAHFCPGALRPSRTEMGLEQAEQAWMSCQLLIQ